MNTERSAHSGAVRILLLAAGTMTCAAGCDSGPPVAEPVSREVVTTAASANEDSLRAMRFLSIADGDSAGRWLALQAHRGGHKHVPDQKERSAYDRRSDTLATLLQEDRRMVANRTVQSRDLLAEQGVHESLASLLDGMVEVARLGLPGNYTAYCDWYINLRLSGRDHLESIAGMKILRNPGKP